MLTVTAFSRQLVASRADESESVQSTSDEALITAIAGGDKRAMQVLYKRHNARVYRFVLRLTANASLAEDLVSEVFHRRVAPS